MPPHLNSISLGQFSDHHLPRRPLAPKHWAWLFGLTVALVAGCGSDGESAVGQQPNRPDHAVVTDVIDGDTIELTAAGHRHRVRLLGVDAPESVHPTVPTQCFGQEASAGLAAALPAGTIVRLERDTEARDRYDRLLLYVFRADDELFINRWLVGQGLADVVIYEPNSARAAELNQARSQARSQRAGLWGACDGPDQPLE